MKKNFISLILVFSLVLAGCGFDKPLIVKNEKDFTQILKSDNPTPTVIIAHGCGGAGTGADAVWAYYINKAGFNTVMLNSFEPRGYRSICNRGMLVPPNSRALDIENVAIWVKSQSWHKGGVAVLGFSHGASTALNISNNNNIKNIDASIAFYPYCGLQEGRDFIGLSISKPRIPSQVHLGMKDTWTPPELCKYMNMYNYYSYENATHGFDINQPRRFLHGHWMEYDEQATNLSRNRVIEFLKSNLQ